jgi:hypothetical protein
MGRKKKREKSNWGFFYPMLGMLENPKKSEISYFSFFGYIISYFL